MNSVNIVGDDFLSRIEAVRAELSKNVARAHQVLDDRERELISELHLIEANYRGEGYIKQIEQLKITKEQTISTLTDNENKDFLEQSVATLDARIREIEAKIVANKDSMKRVELEWDEFLERVLRQTGSIQLITGPGDIAYDLAIEELMLSDRAWCELKIMDNSFWKIDLDSTIFVKLATSLNENGRFWALLQDSQDILNDTFDHLFEQLQSYAESYSWQTNKCFKVGTLCVAQFYLDKRWYRALIEELEDGQNARVRFLDYGNSQVTLFEHLLHLPPQFCQMPFQAILCSMNFTTDVILTQTRREKFSELLEDDDVKYFSCVVKRIEGPVHYVNIYKVNPDNTDLNLYINEEVLLSDLHVPKIELRNKSWTNSIKSPSFLENTSYYHSSSTDSEWTPPLIKSPNEEFSETHEFNEFRAKENSQNPTQQTGAEYLPKQDWKTSSPKKEWNNREQRRPNRKSNDTFKGEYSRSWQFQPCTPSLYIKCEYFLNKSRSDINKTMTDILKDYIDHVTDVFPDTRSGGPIVFLDVDSHKMAIEILRFLNNKVMHIEHYDLCVELAKRYKKYLNVKK
ncbi:hypothetical protein LOD99_776 [Oopsacas minuta]|uniref:Tudor domain-containing protein n=1 Tax=Oopsacas minuta TaxID=111878 RepID=A0AAV7K1B4_9METZ|nr:hypothetical protein LOD99_776 [Oopsacas minuta]